VVRLSKHAADEMEGRNILRSYIDAMLTRSHRKIPEFGGRVAGGAPGRRRHFRGDCPLGQRGEAVIRANYHAEADVLHILFGPNDARSDTSEEVAPGIYVEFDPAGNPIGLEITSVNKRDVQRPKAA
jgi:uncharacterized protein YuzE